MRRVLTVVAACVGLGASLPAGAATHWLCGLSEDLVRLVCVADPDGREAGTALAAGSDPSPGTVVRGTRFPLDPAEVYTVELWTPPSDPEWLALLARSTLCHRSPGCTVSLSPLQMARRR
jgi:hypothetical protein